MLKKLWRWEFWPMWLFYLPIYAVYLWYSLRARSMTFFTAANPGMFMGGFIDYSKYEILQKIPQELVPKGFLIPEENAELSILKHIEQGDISYPFILKPDRGQRGYAVAKIDNAEALQKYLAGHSTIFILQEYISLPLEFGVLYYRYPDQERGRVNSVVQKLFLTVTGDGKSTLLELFKKSDRAQFYLEKLKKRYIDKLSNIPRNGEEIMLEEIGNHSRGTAFLNANHLINEQLIETFDHISQQIDGFYFGRYDLRTASLEDLYAGKVKIMELNGTNSEPAHIYDPNMSIFKAYAFMFGHWKTIFRIGTTNRKKGIAYMPLREAIRITRGHYRRQKVEVKEV